MGDSRWETSGSVSGSGTLKDCKYLLVDIWVLSILRSSNIGDVVASIMINSSNTSSSVEHVTPFCYLVPMTMRSVSDV